MSRKIDKINLNSNDKKLISKFQKLYIPVSYCDACNVKQKTISEILTSLEINFRADYYRYLYSTKRIYKDVAISYFRGKIRLKGTVKDKNELEKLRRKLSEFKTTFLLDVRFLDTKK